MTGAHLTYHSFEFTFPATEPPSWASQVERWYQLDAFAFGLPQAAGYWGLPQLIDRSASHSASVSTPDMGTVSWPSHLILASPEGSNRTDADFARSFMKTGIGSPSKFVHTLPNSRSAALLQVLSWYGPLICIQNDPSSFVDALEEAFDLLVAGEEIEQNNKQSAYHALNHAHPQKSIWVLGVTRRDDFHFTTHLFRVEKTRAANASEGPAPIYAENGIGNGRNFFIRPRFEKSRPESFVNQIERSTSTDRDLITWLDLVNRDLVDRQKLFTLNSRCEILADDNPADSVIEDFHEIRQRMSQRIST